MSEGLTFAGIGATNNSTDETTTDATPRKITAFDTDGPANRVTNDASAGTLTIVEAGTYSIEGHVCFSGTLSKTFKIQVYKGTTAIGVPMERKLGTGGDVGSASFKALAVLAVGDVISAYHWSTDGGTTFLAQQIYLTATRMK